VQSFWANWHLLGQPDSFIIEDTEYLLKSLGKKYAES